MTPLAREITETIAQDGPITVARYVSLCLGHPRYGYYATRDPFGAAGDFVTAPEISQMFGELLGFWCAEVWIRMGEPARVALIELGPGRGTLMADALRAAKASPRFFDAIEVTLVETSPTLRDVQKRTLAGAGKAVRWCGTVEEALGEGSPLGTRAPNPDRSAVLHLSPVGRGRPTGPGEGVPPFPDDPDPPHPLGCADLPLPAGERLRGAQLRCSVPASPLPVLVLANEFFDALPVRQFVRTPAGWRERMVGLDETGALAFGLASEPPADVRLPDRPEGFVIEINPEGLSIAARLGAHVTAHGGAVLAIDYGDAMSAGDTLQAVRRHAFAHPLAEPGEADLTAQVDFGALARAAAAAGAAPMQLLPQADLLERLGLGPRAERLKRNATAPQAAAIDSAVARLTDRSVTGMGALFKAFAFADPRLGPLPAFESPDGALE